MSVEATVSTGKVSFHETIAYCLKKQNFLVLKGKLTVDEGLKKPFEAFTAIFGKLTQQISHLGFLNRKVDAGRFVVKDGIVSPDERRYTARAQFFENKDLYKNVFLKMLIANTVKCLPENNKSRLVQVMLTRHDHSVEKLGSHSDGLPFEWVVQYNIFRSPKGIKGGEVQIVDQDGKVLEKALLDAPLDCYFVNDIELMHSATALQIEEGSVRDTLVIRIEKENSKSFESDSKSNEVLNLDLL